MVMTNDVRLHHREASSRCAEIRARLGDFADDLLGPVAAGEVAGHLLGCDTCSIAFGELLMAQPETGDIVLVKPAPVPPLTLFDDYLRMRRVPNVWRRLLDATKREELRAKADATVKEIIAGVSRIVVPALPPPRKAYTESLFRLRAEVLDAVGQLSGDGVNFVPAGHARIDASGRFTFRLTTDSSEYDGRLLACTITSSPAVSFEAPIVEEPAATGRRLVTFDEQGLPTATGLIPLSSLALTVL